MGKGLGKGAANEAIYILRIFVIILNIFTSVRLPLNIYFI